MDETDFQFVPQEAYDPFISELNPRELTEIIKLRGSMSERIFQGFRPGSQAVRTLVVRQRIAREFSADCVFRAALLDLWVESHTPLLDFVESLTSQEITDALPRIAQMVGGINLYLALMFDGRKGVRKIAEKQGPKFLMVQASPVPPCPPAESPTSSPSSHHTDRSEKLTQDLKSAKDKAAQLAKENRALEQQFKTLRRSAERAEKNAAKLTSEMQEVRHAQADVLSRAERAERDRGRALQKVEELERRVRELRRALDAKPEEQASKPPAAPWQDAVAQLLKEGNHQPAIDFLAALADCANDDPRPHELLHRAYRAAGQPERQRDELVWLGRYYLSTGSIGAAADRLCRALVLAPDSFAIRSLLCSVFTRTDLRNEKRMSELRKALFKLRQTQPDIHQQVLALAKTVSPVLAQVLEQMPREPQIDRIFKLEYNGAARHVSPRQMIRAIDENDVETVRFLRDALKVLRQKAPQAFQMVENAVREQDSSCCVTLACNTCSAVMDASNVAHYLTSPDGKARLRNIILLRQELRRKCYFPVYIYADAALPYQVDRQAELLQMVESGQIELVDAKTDADEAIISCARRLGCPVITRDRMADWDPQGEVVKIRYDLDQDTAEVFDLNW